MKSNIRDGSQTQRHGSPVSSDALGPLGRDSRSNNGRWFSRKPRESPLVWGVEAGEEGTSPRVCGWGGVARQKRHAEAIQGRDRQREGSRGREEGEGVREGTGK